jgi:hypothetical protein
MWAHRVCSADSLTWDDVCQLWDNGVYNATEVKIIAPLFFDGAELSAVLDVIEAVEKESQILEAMNGDSWSDSWGDSWGDSRVDSWDNFWDYDLQPAAMDIDIGTFKCIEPKRAKNLSEPDRDNPWHGLH